MSRKLLLHTCCGPCATYTVQHWQSQGWDVTCFWYNPNIHPFTEHQQRLEALLHMCREADIHLLEAEGYDMIRYFRSVVGHEADRCGYCFRLRLERTAREAAEGGFDAFTTTLLVSPYQKHELLRQVGGASDPSWGASLREPSCSTHTHISSHAGCSTAAHTNAE